MPAFETAGAITEAGGYETFMRFWQQPDRPDGLKHEGWTWGSVGAVYAETPDRIWIAQRGELPLPAGAKPWTAYGALTPARTATGNDDGLGATCEPAEKRGWQRRYHHVIFVVDRNGKLVQEWPQHDKLFEMTCGRGPHKIKMSPYDKEKHVWVIDDQLHVIYKFTYEGKLALTLGTKGKRGRDRGVLFDRPTDIAWLPDGTFFMENFCSTGALLRRTALIQVPMSGTLSIASRSATTGGYSSWTGDTGEYKSLTRTVNSSICGQPGFDLYRTLT